MASITQGSQSNMTPVAERRRPSSDVRSDSTSKEQKRRKIDEGEGFGIGTFSCWCGKLKWKNQSICPKVINQTDVFSIKNVEEVLDSDKCGNMAEDIGKILTPREQAHAHAEKSMVTSKHLDVEKSPIEQYTSSGNYGSLTKNIEELFTRKEKLFGRLNSFSFMTSQKNFKMGQSTKKENLESNPPAIQEIIDLEDDNDPTEKGTTVHSAKVEENGRTVHSLPSEEISSMPIVIIDLEDEDLDSEKDLCAPEIIDLTEPAVNVSEKNLEVHQFFSPEFEKNLCPPEVIDLTEPAINVLEKNLEDQGYAKDESKREGNYCHAGETEVDKNEGAIGSYQATLMDDQVIDQGYAKDESKREGNYCHAGETEVEKNEGAIGPYETTLMDDQVIDQDCVEDRRLDRANFSLDAETKRKTDNGVIGCCETINMHGEVINLGCVEGQRSEEGNFCHGGETEFQKDDGAMRKGNFYHAGDTVLKKHKGVNMGGQSSEKMQEAKEQTKASSDDVANVSEVTKDKGVYVGVEDDAETEEGVVKFDYGHGSLGNIWNEMSFALECCKDIFVDSSSNEHTGGGVEDCDHSFILKDDIGSVCRVCGLIEKGIDTIIEYQFGKSKRSGRNYKYERSHGNGSDRTSIVPDVIKSVEHDCSSSEIAVHPRHQKLMKPHQFEGFNFLVSNLVTDHPGGCVMAHAPGSGKTFMIISFLQSFMAKYPSARPLIVLPRGILSTWRKEFQRWQVEDLPLYDLYSSKAESRSQQLEVLTEWANERSILFLGYKQFASIVCDTDSSKTTIACQDILLTCPTILILDEGHTPRNQNTDILKSLEKVQTVRKVVLSGTLYQNHVNEVFNVLNLVRPKFLRTEPPRSIKRRILSKIQISSPRSSLKNCSDDFFYDMVESTILHDKKFNRKVNIIQDLREMTSKVLHCYKGDSLDELPGLVDFTIFLELSTRQKREMEELKKCKNRFKINSEGSAIYVHPQLTAVLKYSGGKGKVDVEQIDIILEDLKEIGVKAKFYLNLLELCESTGEKLLVFSQYLVPLKFLERLTVKAKNYAVGREIFVITGDSDSEIRDSSMEQFNTSSHARVFFGSIKACGEGISLVGASRIIIVDIHLNPSVTRQAIGRAFRPGQERKVYTYRLVASGSPEEEDHLTCFRKECIAKMWFEWNVCQGQQDFEMEKVDVNDCGDVFLETSRLNADVVSVCKR